VLLLLHMPGTCRAHHADSRRTEPAADHPIPKETCRREEIICVQKLKALGILAFYKGSNSGSGTAGTVEKYVAFHPLGPGSTYIACIAAMV